MGAYILRRLFLIVPTLFGIMLINFLIVQVAPGGPVEQLVAELKGQGGDASQRITREGGELTATANVTSGNDSASAYRGAQGLSPDFIAQIERQYGFDKPLMERFWKMLGDYAVFDFGKSFFRDQKVVDLVLEKMPVSISLGLWSTLIVYLVSIPLGIRKAMRDGSRFDVWTSVALILGTAVPSFLFAVFLLVVFAGGSYLDWFPLAGLVSENWDELGLWAKIGDYLWHMVLPVTALTVGGFAGLAMLTKNSFVEQLSQQYVVTARAKGMTERRLLYGQVFRNAMLLVIAGLPATLLGILFTGAVLVEVIFSLDGLGYLGFEAVLRRDYPVMFATLYFFSLLGLLMNIVGDITYTIVDPRIDFAGR